MEPVPVEGASPINWRLHIGLFVATCATTFFAGGISAGTKEVPFSIWSGLVYSVSIMGILLVHEMGHYLTARKHRVDASLPYFIPVPLPPIGTFGAVIRMRKPPRTRTSLLEIGYAGPLAGLVVAIVVCYIGLELSEVHPLEDLPRGAIMEGNSLLYLLLKWLAHPEMGPTDDVFLHPMAWAGWLGLLVTSLNLLPAGQLDGGHVVYALAGPRRHLKIARIVHVMVFLMGMIGLVCQILILFGPVTKALKAADLLPIVLRGAGMLPWLFWTILLRFVGGEHPPVEDLEKPLSRGRLITGLITLAVIVLTFTPSIVSPVRP